METAQVSTTVWMAEQHEVCSYNTSMTETWERAWLCWHLWKKIVESQSACGAST